MVDADFARKDLHCAAGRHAAMRLRSAKVLPAGNSRGRGGRKCMIKKKFNFVAQIVFKLKKRPSEPALGSDFGGSSTELSTASVDNFT